MNLPLQRSHLENDLSHPSVSQVAGIRVTQRHFHNSQQGRRHVN